MKIRILLFLILTVGLGQLTVFAQNEREVAKIRAEVNLINKNLRNYTGKTKNIEGLSLEGSEAVFYTSGKGLKKITAKMYGETYNSVAEIYYKGEQPIFIFLKFNKYDTQIGLEKPPKVVRTEEERIYYAGEKTVRVMIGQNVLKPEDVRFQEIEYKLSDLASILKAAYSN